MIVSRLWHLIRHLDIETKRMSSRRAGRPGTSPPELGFDAKDQTRMATAVSEIARNAYHYAAGGTAEFLVDRSGKRTLRSPISDPGRGSRT